MRAFAVTAALLCCTVALPARAQGTPGTAETAAVRSVVERYLHGLKFNDTVSFHDAFLPDAKLYFRRRDGQLGALSQHDWYAGFAKTAGQEEAGELRITALEVTGDIASAKVEEEYAKVRYTDYLALVRIGDRWQIVNKVFTAAPR